MVCWLVTGKAKSIFLQTWKYTEFYGISDVVELLLAPE